jgi:hypothetical protein
VRKALRQNSYKEIKNITSTDRDISILKAVKAVNSYIPSYCNREFTEYYATDKTEYFDGTDTNEIYPDVYPIVSVTSLKTSADGGQTYDTILAEYTDFVIDSKNSRIVSTIDYFVYANIPINSVELVYKGGYANVPEDLELAAAHLVEYYLDEQYTPKKAFSGVTVENINVTDNTARLPAHVRRILEHYRALTL